DSELQLGCNTFQLGTDWTHELRSRFDEGASRGVSTGHRIGKRERRRGGAHFEAAAIAFSPPAECARAEPCSARGASESGTQARQRQAQREPERGGGDADPKALGIRRDETLRTSQVQRSKHVAGELVAAAGEWNESSVE